MNDTLGAADVVVVGAGIVGLAHAYEALERGLSVAVVERDERAAGASVRNFGHACATAQDGVALEYGLAARERWVKLADAAGFWLGRTGTVMVARAEDELAVLTEFGQLRGAEVRALTAAEVARRVPVGPGVVGGAFLPDDLRIDQRAAAAAIARHLAERGARFHWATTALAVEPGLVRTSRGELRAGSIVFAAGHDVDRHFPRLAERFAVRRCVLRMLRVDNPHGTVIEPAVQTGFSLLRYGGFNACPSLPAVRERLTREHPELIGIGLNLMFTQRPDGTLTIGDTHAYDVTPSPFDQEELDAAVLRESARLLGAPELTVRERWRGVYASGTSPFLVAAPADGIRVVSVTSGVGMTTALGLAPRVLDTLDGEGTPSAAELAALCG
ncbi:TIGR03364 family FAD-dependent oxidoreductase [Kitasatospora sp. NBC_01287]|uniref:TIGR03364 family FAD-dependent oxidoreductase n=1 Tax=Kitasatospora sp. NBC_01287 TaxID=2903573 RepID=UPI002259EDBA|nr:TIGR03364 family FAD-dependent oxidoreductase [Kitasatospora sp. NBC_01287]MCX4750030.1 TIGR03364 family FAD-dependent oxidoreductase [Kitasatospora sp. NBC_01287]